DINTTGVSLLILSLMHFNFVFFQAEDGIRDRNVTGVQTCALPIFHQVEFSRGAAALSGADQVSGPSEGHALHVAAAVGAEDQTRSEERRVGKEGIRGWTADHLKEEIV